MNERIDALQMFTAWHEGLKTAVKTGRCKIAAKNRFEGFWRQMQFDLIGHLQENHQDEEKLAQKIGIGEHEINTVNGNKKRAAHEIVGHVGSRALILHGAGVGIIGQVQPAFINEALIEDEKTVAEFKKDIAAEEGIENEFLERKSQNVA